LQSSAALSGKQVATARKRPGFPGLFPRSGIL
jgi:hypothetical protein